MVQPSKLMWIDNVFVNPATVLVEQIQKQFKHVQDVRVEACVQSCVRWVQVCTLKVLAPVINVMVRVK